MRAGNLLRQLDQRLLPPLTRAVTRLGERSARSGVLTWAAVLSCGGGAGHRGLGRRRHSGRRPDGRRGDPGRCGRRRLRPRLPAVRRRRPGRAARVGAVRRGRDLRAGHARRVPAAAAAGDGARRRRGLRPCSGGCRCPAGRPRSSRSPRCGCRTTWWPGWTEVAARKDGEAADYRARAAAVDGDGPDERELRERTPAAPRWPPPRRPRTGPAAPASTRRWSARRRRRCAVSRPGRMYGRSTPRPRCTGWTGRSSPRRCPSSVTWCARPPTPGRVRRRPVRAGTRRRRPRAPAPIGVRGRIVGTRTGRDDSVTRTVEPEPTEPAPPSVTTSPDGTRRRAADASPSS